MKILLFTFIQLLFTLIIVAQGLVIDNTPSFVLTANSNLIISADGMQSGIYNRGGRTFNINSNVKFVGNTEQFIGGNDIITFGNVLIRNSSTGGVYLNIKTNIYGTLTMNIGKFNLRDQICDLGTTGTVSGEYDNSPIVATDASWNIGGGTGIIRAWRDNPSGNVAGLGLNFTPASSLGLNTAVIRGCNALQGSGSYTSNWSIFRWYRIEPTNPISDITVNNFYFFGGGTDHELNGHLENNLIMFQRVQFGGGSNPIYWEPRNTTGCAPTCDYVNSSTRSDISLNYIEITLGSTTKPLPVDFINYHVHCQQSSNILTWQTASESNNYGFVIQKSHDANEWEYLGFVAGQNYSNTTTSYQFVDYYPYYPVTYYRLLQTDNDGSITPLSVVSANCNNASSSVVEEDITALLSDGMLNILIQGNTETIYRIYITNVLGQVIYQQKVHLTESLQRFFIEQPLATGMYYINLIGNNNYISKPFIIAK